MSLRQFGSFALALVVSAGLGNGVAWLLKMPEEGPHLMLVGLISILWWRRTGDE